MTNSPRKSSEASLSPARDLGVTLCLPTVHVQSCPENGPFGHTKGWWSPEWPAPGPSTSWKASPASPALFPELVLTEPHLNWASHDPIPGNEGLDPPGKELFMCSVAEQANQPWSGVSRERARARLRGPQPCKWRSGNSLFHFEINFFQREINHSWYIYFLRNEGRLSAASPPAPHPHLWYLEKQKMCMWNAMP